MARPGVVGQGRARFGVLRCGAVMARRGELRRVVGSVGFGKARSG